MALIKNKQANKLQNRFCIFHVFQEKQFEFKELKRVRSPSLITDAGIIVNHCVTLA